MRLDRLAVLGLATFIASEANRDAQAAFLADANSQVTVDERNGLTVWRVNNTADNVFLSNYYLRVGSTGNELALRDALGVPVVSTSGTNRVTLTYENASLRAVVDYTLAGGPAGSFDSRISSSISLTNLSGGALDLHLFQYSDFDLAFDQARQLDQLRFLSPSSLVQYRAGTPYLLEASVGTAPTHYQATSSFIDFYLKFFLDQDGPTTLNDTPGIGQLFPEPASDSAFAFQWDRTLAAGGNFAVASQFRLGTVPEPSSVVMTAIGCAGLGIVGRRRSRSSGGRSA